jgi:hypothetical protein
MSSDNNIKSNQKNTLLNITIGPKKLLIKLLYCIGFLVFANILGIISKLVFNHHYCHGLIPMFDFDAEMNFPTFYSSITLLFSSVLLAIIAFCHKKAENPYWLWGGLSIIFLFLSIDEFGSLHERFEAPCLSLLENSGCLELSKIFFYAWVIPYGLALIAFVALYLKFLFKLPRKTMILFIVSGIIYVTGAVGLEVLGGIEDRLHSSNTLIYLVLCTIEESLEMLGIAIFIYTLLSYISEQFKSFSISVEKSKKNDARN